MTVPPTSCNRHTAGVTDKESGRGKNGRAFTHGPSRPTVSALARRSATRRRQDVDLHSRPAAPRKEGKNVQRSAGRCFSAVLLDRVRARCGYASVMLRVRGRVARGRIAVDDALGAVVDLVVVDEVWSPELDVELERRLAAVTAKLRGRHRRDRAVLRRPLCARRIGSLSQGAELEWGTPRSTDAPSSLPDRLPANDFGALACARAPKKLPSSRRVTGVDVLGIEPRTSRVRF